MSNDRATASTGEHHSDVPPTVNEDTKVTLKFAISVGGLIVGGIMSFLVLQGQVSAQDTRVDGLEKVMCAVAKKLDVLVAECSGN